MHNGPAPRWESLSLGHRALLWLGHLWAFPVTFAGLLAALIGHTRFAGFAYDRTVYFVAAPRGLCDRFFKRFNVVAFTWGSVIIFCDAKYLRMPLLLKHEHVHVRQCMTLGLLIPLAYGVASLVALFKRTHPYVDNHFEREARRRATWIAWP